MPMTSRELQQRYYEMLLDSQFWPEADLIAHQRSQLSQLLNHARTQSPFYASRLDAVFRSDGAVDWERWSEIPILTRGELIAHHDEVTARALPPGHGPVGEISTSGTTGTPLRVIVPNLAMVASHAARWRANRWHDIDWSGTLYMRYGEDPAAVPPDGLSGGSWGPPGDSRAAAGRWVMLNRLVSGADQLGFLSRTHADYAAAGGPKHAHALAIEADRLGISVDLKAIFVNGEAVDESDRAACREIFGARVIDVYSSKEGQHMAHRCPDSGLWHVTAENLLLEVVDDEGKPCGPGETGRVVITPFFSTAQPLIRYAQGDLAEVGEPCGCGRNLPTLVQIMGRVIHMFRHPDGRRIARGLPEIYRQVLKSGPWQFAQIGATTFEVRYVPLDWNEQGDEEAVATAFRQWYFADATVVFRRMPAIRTAPSGKFIEYTYEVP